METFLAWEQVYKKNQDLIHKGQELAQRVVKNTNLASVPGQIVNDRQTDSKEATRSR